MMRDKQLLRRGTARRIKRMSPARSEQDETRGWIIPVGGAEEGRAPQDSQRFVRLSGGDEAKIAIIPTASALDETGTQYEDLFVELGAQGKSRCLIVSAPTPRMRTGWTP